MQGCRLAASAITADTTTAGTITARFAIGAATVHPDHSSSRSQPTRPEQTGSADVAGTVRIPPTPPLRGDSDRIDRTQRFLTVLVRSDHAADTNTVGPDSVPPADRPSPPYRLQPISDRRKSHARRSSSAESRCTSLPISFPICSCPRQ
jgi:hypothetical protein